VRVRRADPATQPGTRTPLGSAFPFVMQQNAIRPSAWSRSNVAYFDIWLRKLRQMSKYIANCSPQLIVDGRR